MTTYFNKIAVLDIIIVVMHLLICICIGLYHLNKTRTEKDFYTVKGVKNLPLMLLCTIFATAVGGNTIIGYIDEIYNNPMVLLFIITQPFFWIVTSKIVTSGINKFNGCTTLTQIMYRLFGKHGNIITIFAVIIDCIGATTIQIFAFGSICHYFFGLNLWYSIIIGTLVINIYSISGGFKGIIAIDVFQFLIFFFIIPVSYIIMIQNVEYNGNFLHSISLSNYNFKFNLITSIGLLTASLMPELSAPFIQRYLMLANNIKALKIIFKKLLLITTPFILSICLIAYLIIIKVVNNNTLPSNIIFHIKPIKLPKIPEKVNNKE